LIRHAFSELRFTYGWYRNNHLPILASSRLINSGQTLCASRRSPQALNAQLASSTDSLAENPKLARQADAGPPPGCHYEMQPAMEVTQRFVWGLDYIDEKIASYGPDGTQYFTLQDANYNVVGKVMGPSISKLYQYAYDPYGQIIAPEYIPHLGRAVEPLSRCDWRYALSGSTVGTCEATPSPSVTSNRALDHFFRSNRSRFITLLQAAVKSWTNLSFASSPA